MKSKAAAKCSIKQADNKFDVTILNSNFDLQNAHIISETCIGLSENITMKMLALNFEKVDYLSTAGIKSLLEIYYKLVYCNNNVFYIYNVKKDIKDIFRSTMVDSVLCISD